MDIFLHKLHFLGFYNKFSEKFGALPICFSLLDFSWIIFDYDIC